MKVKYYIDNFLIYSILGFVIEKTLKFLFFHGMKGGNLIGPWIPIYGIGTCIIIFLMRFTFNRIKVKRYIKILLLFIFSTIVLTLLEYLGGNLMEIISGKIAWDYSKMPLHLGKYICLEMSIVWGFSSLIVIYLIKPKVDKIIKKMPSIITYFTFSLFILDLLNSFLTN